MKVLCWILLTLMPTVLMATPFVPSQRCPGDFTVAAEWIYFSLPSETSYIATPTDPEAPLPAGPLLLNRLDGFYSGYRLAANYTPCTCLCDSFFSLQWTSLQAEHSRTVTGDTLFLTNFGFLAGPPLRGSRRFRYYAIDGVMGRNVICSPCISCDFLAGIQWAHIMTLNRIVSPNVQVPTRGLETNDFWGVGPQVGIYTRACLGWNFSFIAQLAGGFLVGKPLYNFDVTGQQGLATQGILERAWRFVPHSNLRLALDWTYNPPDCVCQRFSRLKGGLLIGYEGIMYWNPLTSTNLVGFQPIRDVTLHGPFVEAYIAF